MLRLLTKKEKNINAEQIVGIHITLSKDIRRIMNATEDTETFSHWDKIRRTRQRRHITVYNYHQSYQGEQGASILQNTLQRLRVAHTLDLIQGDTTKPHRQNSHHTTGMDEEPP